MKNQNNTKKVALTALLIIGIVLFNYVWKVLVSPAPPHRWEMLLVVIFTQLYFRIRAKYVIFLSIAVFFLSLLLIFRKDYLEANDAGDIAFFIFGYGLVVRFFELFLQ